MKIKSIHGCTLFESKHDTLKDALQEAVAKSANLYEASLDGANLVRANLDGASLYEANLYGASLDGANLARANLDGANLVRANLYEANLYGASLYEASLYEASLVRANLDGANLYGANLDGANLDGANLYGASGLNKFQTNPLHAMQFATGTINGFKLVNANGEGVHRGGIKYQVGETVRINKADCDYDESTQCGSGINLATLDWCLKEKSNDSQKILLCEFTAKDLVAVPLGTDGKFRVKKCKVVRELKPEEYGE